MLPHRLLELYAASPGVLDRSLLRSGRAFPSSRLPLSNARPTRRQPLQCGRPEPREAVALLYFGSHNLRGNRFRALQFARLSVCTHSPLICRARLAPRFPSRFGILKKRSLWISASAALAAAVALAGCGSTYLFCRPHAAPQRADQSRRDRNPEPQRPGQGALQIVDAFYDDPQRLQRHAGIVFHCRIWRRTARHHPEHAGRAVRRGLWLGRRQPHSRQLRGRKDHRHRKRPAPVLPPASS